MEIDGYLLPKSFLLVREFPDVFLNVSRLRDTRLTGGDLLLNFTNSNTQCTQVGLNLPQFDAVMKFTLNNLDKNVIQIRYKINSHGDQLWTNKYTWWVLIEFRSCSTCLAILASLALSSPVFASRVDSSSATFFNSSKGDALSRCLETTASQTPKNSRLRSRHSCHYKMQLLLSLLIYLFLPRSEDTGKTTVCF